MAVTSTASSIEYGGDGATLDFPTVFRFLKEEHLAVSIRSLGGDPVIKTLGVHYAVFGVGADAGGTVRFFVAPTALETVRIERNTPIVQDIHFALQGDFFPETHEKAFDTGAMVDQELERRVATLENGSTTNNAVAGSGMFVDGFGAWHVGAGLGVQVNADDVEVVYGVAGDVAAVNGGPASAGMFDRAARADHKHVLALGPPVPLGVGVGAADGVSNAAARADHVHEIAAPTVVANVSAAAGALGASTTPAREDHAHQVATAGPVAIGQANAAGGFASLARADHVHAHGAQPIGDGTNHALAQAGGFAGFMSGTDKAKLDALASTAYGGAVRTNDGTPSVVTARDVADGQLELHEASITGRKASGQGAGYIIAAAFRKDGGVVTQIGATTVLVSLEDDAAMDVGFVVAGGQVQVKVTGVAGATISWRANVRVTSSP